MWLHSSSLRRPPSYHTSSFYVCPIITLLLWSGRFYAFAYKLGLVFFVLGCVVIAEWKRLDPTMMNAVCALNLLGHLSFLLFPPPQEDEWHPRDSVAILGVVAGILGVYYLVDMWPYPVSPFEFSTIAFTTVLVYDLVIHGVASSP